jgi:hypothetical protein
MQRTDGSRGGLPLRAAAIFAPLSSRTAAPSTTRSHNVARKGRVPKAAVITFRLLDGVKCSFFVLTCQAALPQTGQALERTGGFR